MNQYKPLHDLLKKWEQEQGYWGSIGDIDIADNMSVYISELKNAIDQLPTCEKCDDAIPYCNTCYGFSEYKPKTEIK